MEVGCSWFTLVFARNMDKLSNDKKGRCIVLVLYCTVLTYPSLLLFRKKRSPYQRFSCLYKTFVRNFENVACKKLANYLFFLL